MLVQRRRRWNNIKPTLIQLPVNSTNTKRSPNVSLMLGQRLTWYRSDSSSQNTFQS